MNFGFYSAPHLRPEDFAGRAARDLPTRRADFVRRHLETCAVCRAEWDATQTLWHAAQASAMEAAPTPPDALRERIFAALPAAPPAARLERKRFIMPSVFVRPVVGASVIGAFAVTALSVGLLYGPALVLHAPRAVAFSEVEAAMSTLKTVEWTETRIDPKSSGTGFKISDTTSVWVNLGKPSLVYKSAAFAHKSGGHRFLETQRGTLSFTPGGTDYFLFDGGPSKQESAAQLRHRLVESVIFPRGATAQNAVQTSSGSAGSKDTPFKWRSTPWKSETVSLAGKPALRFSRHSVRFRDDDPWWKKQIKQEYNLTIFANPNTYRIVRREWQQTTGVGGRSRTVSTDFHYNETPPENTFDAVAPPVGQPVIFTDWTDTGIRAKISDAKKQDAIALVRRLADARSKSDWETYSGLRDFAYVPLDHKLYWANKINPSTKPKADDPYRSEAAFRAGIEKSFKSDTPYKSWHIDKIVGVAYGFNYIYTRKSENEIFPPVTLPTTFEVRADVTPVTKTGKQPQQVVVFVVTETNAGLRVADIRFEGAPRPPRNDGMSASEFGMRAVVGGVPVAPKKAAKTKK